MNGFSFSDTAGASQSTTKTRLVGNNIYKVTFDGIESEDIQGVKDPTMVYRVLKLKFSSPDGTFEHTIFEPKDSDFDRTEREITTKEGKKEKIPQVSNYETLKLLIKHAMDVLNPVIAGKIDNGSANLTAKDWNGLRTQICSVLNVGKGITTNIKLLKNKKGDATFPSFFAAINKDGQIYVKNNFIGEKLAFTPYEKTRIENEENSVPTKVATYSPVTPEIDLNSTEGIDLNLNFEVPLI